MADETNTRAAGIGVDSNAIAFRPTTWEQLVNFANMIAKTSFVPKDMHGDGGAVLAAIQYGHEVHLPPMASLQAICVINGRPSLFGDGYWAVINAHPLCEWTTELAPDEALKAGYGEATVKRRGHPEAKTRRYTLEMAKTADLLNKDNWKKYPGVMLMWRARHLAGSAAIPEATKGLIPAAIARDIDIDPGDVNHEEPVKPIALPQPKAGAQPQVEPEKKKRTKKETTSEPDIQPQQTDSPPTDGDNLPPAGGVGPEEAQGSDERPTGQEAEGQALPLAPAHWTDTALPWDERLQLFIAQATDEEFNTDRKANFFYLNFYRVKDMHRGSALCELKDKRDRAK